jgi:hypothetical protein
MFFKKQEPQVDLQLAPKDKIILNSITFVASI